MQEEKILVICPSRGRPKILGRMLDSFFATSKMSSLSVALDSDDPCINEYVGTIAGRCNYSIHLKEPVTQIINSKWAFSAPCFKWFSITNDDFIYRTNGWDVSLTNILKLNKVGIAYGNDLLCGENIPTTSVISREIIREIGWLQLPTLKHLFGDNVWKTIGKGAGCLFYNKNVIIEHMHVFAKKAEADETHNRTNSAEMYKLDADAFADWLTSQSKEDIKKVARLCQNSLQLNG